ncbi:hypothetical protein OROMI_006995 [Orobanche minor]
MTNLELNGNLLTGNIPSELGMVESARCVSMLYSEAQCREASKQSSHMGMC